MSKTNFFNFSVSNIKQYFYKEKIIKKEKIMERQIDCNKNPSCVTNIYHYTCKL